MSEAIVAPLVDVLVELIRLRNFILEKIAGNSGGCGVFSDG
jgi:hypothetical protein